MPLLPFRTLMTLTAVRMRLAIVGDPRPPQLSNVKAEPRVEEPRPKMSFPDRPEDFGKSLANPKDRKAA
jgi:hypothetical protein